MQKNIWYDIMYWYLPVRWNCSENLELIGSKHLDFFFQFSLLLFLCNVYFVRSSHWRCSVRKGAPRNFARKTCAKVSFLTKLLASAYNFITTLFRKETLAQVFSCEFCKISRNTFFTGHLWAIASILWNLNKM